MIRVLHFATPKTNALTFGTVQTVVRSVDELLGPGLPQGYLYFWLHLISFHYTQTQMHRPFTG